ncbi:MAG TPA: dual specificity protein phosphatase [Gemmataceae bacterium]|nr:dual specificity protein phosphatase [Gemmataceae bacterium]
MRHIPDYSLWLGHAGDARDRHELFRVGIGAVVDLAVEEPPAVPGHEIVYCRFPLIDGTENPPWLLRAAIDTTVTLLREKVPTLVCCSAGMSRAPAIAGAALVRLGRPTLQDALLYLAAFGHCDVSAGLLQDIVNVVSD